MNLQIQLRTLEFRPWHRFAVWLKARQRATRDLGTLAIEKLDAVIGQLLHRTRAMLQQHVSLWEQRRHAYAAAMIEAEDLARSADDETKKAKAALQAHEQQYRDLHDNSEPPPGVKTVAAKIGFGIVALGIAVMEFPLTSAALQNWFPTDAERLLASVALCAAPIGLAKYIGSFFAKRTKTIRQELLAWFLVLVLLAILALVSAVRAQHLKDHPPGSQRQMEVKHLVLKGVEHV